mmetsp:Transcript_50500/g.107222  ORF Transcript_50500/g.107222 Transcript_50500/m.107222 type:complete len:131 (+) Transcript_50500:115-507(+)
MQDLKTLGQTRNPITNSKPSQQQAKLLTSRLQIESGLAQIHQTMRASDADVLEEESPWEDQLQPFPCPCCQDRFLRIRRRQQHCTRSCDKGIPRRSNSCLIASSELTAADAPKNAMKIIKTKVFLFSCKE